MPMKKCVHQPKALKIHSSKPCELWDEHSALSILPGRTEGLGQGEAAVDNQGISALLLLLPVLNLIKIHSGFVSFPVADGFGDPPPSRGLGFQLSSQTFLSGNHRAQLCTASAALCRALGRGAAALHCCKDAAQKMHGASRPCSVPET